MQYRHESAQSLASDREGLGGSPSIAARESLVTGRGIDSGWEVDFGSGDWTIAMRIFLVGSPFAQSFFGSDSVDEF